MHRMICTILTLSAALPGLTQEISISIVDLNTTGITPSPTVLVAPGLPILNDRVYFSAIGDDGYELWVTDGTGAGTSYQDLSPGYHGSFPQIFAVVGDRVFFQATTMDSGDELWSTQGPHLAAMVIDLEPGPDDSAPRSLTAFGDDLYFTAFVAGTRGLYAADSQSLALTPLAVDIVEVEYSTGIVDDGSRVYFKGTALSGGSLEIWASDGTDSGTEQVTDDACSNWGELLGVSTSVFAICDEGTSNSLLRLDPGQTSGVVVVHDFGILNVEQLTPAGGTLYMVVDDSEIWGYDNGTGTITQITSFGQTTQPGDLTRFLGNLVFVADADVGRELYWTDGVAVTPIDIQPGAGDSSPKALQVHDGAVYFSADDGVHGRELWRSNGTAAGSQMVADLVPGPEGVTYWLGPSTPFGLLFNLALKGLWKTDGTPTGTVQIPFPDSFATSPSDLHADEAGDRVFLVGDLGVGAEPLLTDGSLAGSLFLGDVFPGPTGSSARFLATLPNGSTLFTAIDGVNGRQLWSTLGFAGDATFVRVIDPGGLPILLGGTVFDDYFYFCADDGVNGVELWRSDGTGVGTEFFFDTHPTDDGEPCNHAVYDGELYFGAYDAAGAGLWRTDGSMAGTELVSMTNSSQENGPMEFTVMGAHLFFSAEDDDLGRELWRSDGTVAGTEILLDINPGADGSKPDHLLAAGGLLFFEANDGTTGSELWRTDGAVAGTVNFDLEPGLPGSEPSDLVVLGNRLFFSAYDAATKREIHILEETLFFDGFETGDTSAW